MKRGTEISWSHDFHDKSILQIKKQRGKLTLDEIEDILRHEDGQRFCGFYAIILNCSEATVGGNGLYFEEEQKGDAVALYPIEEVEDCPVCGEMLPPFSYCPGCGVSWKDADNNAEAVVASMREETEREIRKPTLTLEARVAWYWTFVGAVDMARMMGFITDERRQQIYREVENLKPQ